VGNTVTDITVTIAITVTVTVTVTTTAPRLTERGGDGE